MTKDELIGRLTAALQEAVSNSEAFVAACGHLDEVGLQRRFEIRLTTFERDPAEPAPAQSDEDFLRSLRICSDLEAK